MNNRDARYLLQAYRPNGQDAADPKMTEAVDQARRDPDLGVWFSNEQAFDKAIAAKLKSIRPPEGLKEEILSGVKLAGANPRRRWWVPTAIAAALALAFTAYLVVPKRAKWGEFDTFTENAMAYSRGFISLDYRSTNVAQLTDWLKDRQSPLPVRLPGALNAMPGLGCRTISWKGKTISLICFGHDKIYHLFVMNAAESPAGPATTQPTFLHHGEMAAATWRDSKNVYLLVVQGSDNDLKQLL